MLKLQPLVIFAVMSTAAWNCRAVGETFTVSTAQGNGADIELTENGGAAGAAVAGGNGTKINMNARWNFASDTPDRNEWAAMRFDLGNFVDKSALSSVSLNLYTHRANANNNKNLHLYALTPGTTGEDWAEVGTTYETMPGFTFDADSSTNILDVGGAIVDLGNFATTGSELEGSQIVVDPVGLTSLVQSMGSNHLLTILISTAGSTNGQWRVLTREATGSETGVISGDIGQFAPFLQFEEGAVAGLPGDYNEDFVVDAADYTVWRDRLGQTESLPNDDTAGVMADDYTRWKTNFGMGGSGSGALAIGAAVPEPGSWLLLFVAASQLCHRCRNRK